MIAHRISPIALPLAAFALLAATPPAADSVRRAPPAGLAIRASEREELQQGVARLGSLIEGLNAQLKKSPLLQTLLPDVEIYHKAVQWPLVYHEFLRSNDVAIAKSLLQQGLERAEALREGKAPWTTATGLVVRGYRSRIDGSVQPYGLVVPASYRPKLARPHRLDVWLHGRDNHLTELKFISDRQRTAGEFAPADAFVLHPYGRYCNAFKFAGEVDVFEALEHARRNYPIDGDRITVRGFSMGGAGCWHLAAHHAGIWAAAAPGAGFAETAEYTRILDREPKPPVYEQKLWHLYNATDYAANLLNCPTVAYSGEMDRQKQAADIMARALAAEGAELTHILGPKTEHRYHPQAKIEISARVDRLVAQGRDPIPKKIGFTTWTLRYNQMFWVTVDRLEQHWAQARIDAEFMNDRRVRAATKNISAFTFLIPAGLCPLDNTVRPIVEIDGQQMRAAAVLSDRSWTAGFRKVEGRWEPAHLNGEKETSAGTPDEGLAKRHGLQGPIDDAFLDRFIFVRPTGQPLSETTGAWLAARQIRAVDQWRAQFRGEAIVKTDGEITAEDLASSHLILWGDPSSNRLLAKIANQLPIRWDAKEVALGKQTYSSGRHVPVFVYPNPLNPKRYVVLNSGFTFADVGHLSNALQTPKLPDYAVVEVATAARTSDLDAVVAAGFFDEEWQLPSGMK